MRVPPTVGLGILPQLQSKQCFRDWTDQSNSSIEVASSKVILSCVKLTIRTKEDKAIDQWKSLNNKVLVIKHSFSGGTNWGSYKQMLCYDHKACLVYLLILLFIFLVLEFESRFSHMLLSKCFATESYPKPSFDILFWHMISLHYFPSWHLIHYVA